MVGNGIMVQIYIAETGMYTGSCVVLCIMCMKDR